VPYAAAEDGNYFRVFAKVHPEHRIPHVSLLIMGGVTVIFCFFKLGDVIAALVVIRIIVQFLVQIVGLLLLRWRRPDAPRPFKMWAYPIPALLATFAFVYVLIGRENFMKEIRYALVIIGLGLATFAVRAWREREWPFASN
jgi:amino acid transporter